MSTTTSSCAILARDFSNSMADVLRTRWTAGKMRHVIAALDGTPVAITTDQMSGHTLLGVRLLGLTETFGGGECVIIKGADDDPAWPRPVAYSLTTLGEAIIPLSEQTATTGAKWVALDTYRNERSAAIQRAKRERPDCDYGRWSAVPGRASVSWRYDPQRGPEGTNAAFNGKGEYVVGKPHCAYGSFRLRDLAGEQDYKGEPYAMAVI